MKRYAVYRCLYGEDFVQQSINSIIDYVDKIFIFWTDKAWGNVTECNYRGEIIKFPKKFDNIIDKIKELNNPKIELIYDHQFNTKNQLQHFANDIILPNYDRPDTIIGIDIDHVFRKDQIEAAIEEFDASDFAFAKTDHIELWRYLNYQIPHRSSRISTVFWDIKSLTKFPETGANWNPAGRNLPKMNSIVHNVGFCFSEKVMYWKHLICIAMSKKIKDSPPNIDWYEEKWLNWDFHAHNKNLEISKGYEHTISHAFPYDTQLLPETLK